MYVRNLLNLIKKVFESTLIKQNSYKRVTHSN